MKRWSFKLLLAAWLVSILLNTRTPQIANAVTFDEKEPAVVLFKIALCESSLRQFEKDGKPLRGKVNPQDVGLFQINEKWNGAEAKKLGHDIYTTKGNIDMASHLYKRSGTRDWNWSKPCWSRSLDVILKEKGFGSILLAP